MPIARSPGGVESGCAEVILNEVKLRSDLLGLIAVDIAGRLAAPSPASREDSERAYELRVARDTGDELG